MRISLRIEVRELNDFSVTLLVSVQVPRNRQFASSRQLNQSALPIQVSVIRLGGLPQCRDRGLCLFALPRIILPL